MRSYLVPIDFSSNATRALTAAKALARCTGAYLYVLHAHQPYLNEVTIGRGSLPAFDDLEESFRRELQRHVEELQQEGFAAEGIWVPGGVTEVVRQKIGELNPELVIIGRTGKGGFVDKLFGTAASDIVKVSKVPVLVIPPQARPDTFKEIVYATQLEFEERHVVGAVLKLARDTGGRVTFLKVNSLTQPNIQDDAQFASEIKQDFELSDEDFVLRDAGSVVGGIEKFAEELGADVLVLATRSRGFLEKIFIDPSITGKMIVSAAIPLLIYHLEEQ